MITNIQTGINGKGYLYDDTYVECMVNVSGIKPSQNVYEIGIKYNVAFPIKMLLSDDMVKTLFHSLG